MNRTSQIVRATGALCVSAFALFAPHAGFAQTSPASEAAVMTADEQAKQLSDEALEIQAGGTKDSPAFGSLGNAFQIETETGEATATLTIGYHRTSPTGQKREKNGLKVTTASDSYTVTASAPLGKNGKPSLFDFDKLGDGTSLEFKGMRYWGSATFLPNNDPGSMQFIENRRNGRCIYGESDKWTLKQPNFEAAQKTNSAFRIELQKALDESQGDYDVALGKLASSENEKVKELATALLSCTGAEGSMGSATDYTLESESAAISKLRGNGLVFLGVSGKITRTNYEFLVPTPLAKDDVSHTNYKVQVFGGKVFASGRVSWTGAFSYARSYKLDDDVQLCEPNGVGNQIACFTGPLGAPIQANRYTASSEVRWRIPLPMISEHAAIGLAPRVSYEIKSDSAMLELPVYFAPGKGTKSLNGGIRFAYNTDSDGSGKDDFAFGLFVGVPFSIFTN